MRDVTPEWLAELNSDNESYLREKAHREAARPATAPVLLKLSFYLYVFAAVAGILVVPEFAENVGQGGDVTHVGSIVFLIVAAIGMGVMARFMVAGRSWPRFVLPFEAAVWLLVFVPSLDQFLGLTGVLSLLLATVLMFSPRVNAFLRI